jgi:hypothetical protein
MLVLAGAVCSLGMLAPEALARKAHVFNVRFELEKAQYWYNSTFLGLSQHEQDHFSTSTLYLDLKIPAGGPASHAELKAADEYVAHSGEDPEWESYGSGGGGSYHCKGGLAPKDSKPTLLATPVKKNKHNDVHLVIEATTGYQVEKATGSFNHESTCGQQFDGSTAFRAATGPSRSYMPGMLTVNILAKLSQLRAIKVGDVSNAEVTEKMAVKALPSNCGDACTQHLDWKGKVFLRRTG